MMQLLTSKPWFNGPYVGAGLSLPIAWQGWAVLTAGTAMALLSGILLHGVAREFVPLLALFAIRAIIQIKRAP